MNTNVIIMTGTSAAGKTYIQRILCDKYSNFCKVKAVTTRVQRDDDRLEDYSFITNENFIQLKRENKLLVEAEYRGKRYGITKEDMKKVIDEGKTPIIVITPKSVIQINNICSPLLSFFIDASNDILDKRLSIRGEIYENCLIEKQRTEDRQYIKYCLYYLTNHSSKESAQIIYNLWKEKCCKTT